MDRYRQRTIAELLKKTSKLNRPRMTPILEGKDRMQGPLDTTDPDMDFASLQVCGNCRNHLDASIAQNCGICNRGHHSFCLEVPPNESEDRSVQCCYDCQHQAALDSNQPGSSSKDSHSKILEDRMDVCRSSENVLDCEEPGTSYDVSEHSPATKKMDLSWNEASPSNRIADSGGTIFEALYKPTKTRAARKLGIRRKRVTDSFGLDSSSGQALPSETDSLMAVQESSGMDVTTQIASKATLEGGGVMSACLEAGSEESKDPDRMASSIADMQIKNVRVRSDLEEANGNQLLEVRVVSPSKDAEYTMEDIATGDKLVKEGNVSGSEKLMGSPKLDVALTVQPGSRNSCMQLEDRLTDVSATSEAPPAVEIQEEMKVVGPPSSRDSAKEEHFSKKAWSAAPQMVVEQDVDGERQILIVSQVNFVDQLPKQDGDAHGDAAMVYAADLAPQNTTSQGTCSPTAHRAPAVDVPKNKSSSSSVLEGQSEDDMSKPSAFVDMKRTLPCIQEESIEHLSDGLTNKAGPHKENPGSKAHMDIDSTFTGSETTHAASLSSPNSRVAMEDDIKVCDLCGDAGYEDMLAICSECNGAEHVYCYQNLMAQVPEGYWQCDACKSKQKTGDFRPSTDIRTFNSLPMRLPSLNRKHSTMGNSRSRLSALLQKRRLPSEKKRAMKGIPSSQFPAKRGLPGVDAPPTKKQAVEASSPPYMASTAPSKLGLIKEATFKIPDTGKVKFVSHTALMGGDVTGLSSRGSGKFSLSMGSPSSIPLNPSMVQSGQMSKVRFVSASNSILGPGSAKLNTTSQLNMPSSSAPLVKTSGALKSIESVPSFLPPSKSMGSKLQPSSKGLKETTDSVGPQSLPTKEGLLGQSSISNPRALSKTGSFKLSKVISMGGALDPRLKHDVNIDSAKSSGSRGVHPEVGLMKGGVHPEVGLVKGGESKYEAVLNSGLPEIKSKAEAATESHPPLETHIGVDKLIKHELAGSLPVTNSPSKDETLLVASGTSEALQSSVLGGSVKDVQDLSIEQERKLPFQATSPPHSLARQTPKLPEQVGLDTLKEVSKTSMDVIQSAPLLPRPVILIQESSTFKEDENKPLQLAVSVDALSEKSTLAVVDKAPIQDDNRSSFTPRSRSFGAWGSPSYVPSLGSTRCYRCKELGHSAKNCNNRSSMPCVSSEAAGVMKAGLPAPNVDSTCVLKGVVPASMENAARNVQSNVEAILKIKPTTEMAPIIKPSSTERGVVFVQNLNSIVAEVQSQVEEGQVVEDVVPSSSPLGDQVMRNDTPVSKHIADSVLSAPQANIVGANHTDDTKEIGDGKKEDDNTAVRLVSSTVVSVPSGTQLTTSSAEWQPPLLSIPSTTRSAAHLSAALGPLSSANVKATSPFVSRYQESLKVYPEAQIVWQGAFEVAGKSKPQVSFHGLQANPSNRALPKVREVAKKLQPLLPLEELPRGSEHNSWPVQFQKSPPINDNIALYFFASSKESYVQYYKPLVDRLIKFDLTLKGFIEDAELLIFPSNLLPPGSQCWNNFMFLWAVFRARKLPIKQPNIQFTPNEPKQAGNDSGLKLPVQAGGLTWGKVEDMQIDTIANKNIDIPHAPANKVETPSLTVAESANTGASSALFDSDVVCEQPPPCHQQEPQHLMQVEAVTKEAQKAQAETIHSQPENAVVTALPSIQDSYVVKSQPLSHVLLPTEGGLNLNVSNESSQKFNSSIKLEEKVDTSVKLVVASAPKVTVSAALLRSEHGSIEKAKHSTPLMGTSPALLACPSPRDRQEDVWTPRKLSSHSPAAGQQDKDKGVRERVHEKSDRMESGRGVSRDRDREKIRDREKHKERDRDRERSRRHSDWEREKERERGKERERDRDRDRDRDRGRERERERERDRERWRDRDERDRRGRDWDRDRDKVGERDKGRERGREREAERERALARDRSRHRNWDPAEADYGRSGRYWHRYPRSRTPSRSPPGNRDSSPSRPRLDRYHHRYHRSFRHSRSYSHSPDSDHGLARLQPRAESRDLSKDSFAPKGKSPDIVAGDSRAKEESVVKNSVVKDSGGDEQGNYSQRGSNSNSLCRENTTGKERKLPIADLNLSPSEIEGNEEDGNDDDVMMSVEVAMPLTANQDDHTSGCHDFLPVGVEPGECSISAGKMINTQSAEHLMRVDERADSRSHMRVDERADSQSHMRVDERADSRSHSLMNDSSGPSYIPFSVSREGSSSCLHFFPQPMDDDENRVASIMPDLSLALGAKERSLPQPAELPLFMQLLEPPCQESSRLGSFNASLDVPMVAEQADLSLSLAIPEHSKRPVVNTSLRLFG